MWKMQKKRSSKNEKDSNFKKVNARSLRTKFVAKLPRTETKTPTRYTNPLTRATSSERVAMAQREDLGGNQMMV
jgi:hypothetical protein